MSRNNKLISENLRTEIAKELGVYDGKMYLLKHVEV